MAADLYRTIKILSRYQCVVVLFFIGVVKFQLSRDMFQINVGLDGYVEEGHSVVCSRSSVMQ